jgi:predicted Rossmann fold flavoprotein
MKLIVIGGGAAGFFCAVNAARLNPAMEVIILEKTTKLLSKVKVSGGGRCNVTHGCFDITEMANRYPRGKNFVRKSFHWFFTKDTIQWFEERGVTLKTEADGRMFPVSDSSQSVIDCLMKEARLYGVEIRLQVSVESIHKSDGRFKLQAKASGRDEILEADLICVATGGSSKSESYSWIRTLGHQVADPVPSLFTFNIPSHPITALMGVSLEDAEVKIPLLKEKQRGPLLITHWGLSGPAVLKLSAWCAVGLAGLKYDFSVMVNWVPNYHESGMRDYLVSHREQFASVPVKNKNPFGIPQRLWDFLMHSSGIMNDLRWADLPAVLMNRLARNICSYELKVNGKTTFKEEFVTAGGVNLSEIDPNTMMSRVIPGLYFAGEIMDVDGVTGGYNFQHAWTSGFLAAKAIAGNFGKAEINL